MQQASLEGICKRQARPAISGLPTFDMCTHCPSYLLPRMASKQGLLPYMAHMLEPHSRHDQPCTGLAANPHAMHSMPCTACVSVHLPSCGVFVVLHHDVASTPDAVPILSCCMIIIMHRVNGSQCSDKMIGRSLGLYSPPGLVLRRGPGASLRNAPRQARKREERWNIKPDCKAAAAKPTLLIWRQYGHPSIRHNCS